MNGLDMAIESGGITESLSTLLTVKFFRTFGMSSPDMFTEDLNKVIVHFASLALKSSTRKD